MYEAELYVRDLIPEVRSVMNEYKLVDGGYNLYVCFLYLLESDHKLAMFMV